MAKIETLRIYEQLPAVPKDWSFPPVFLLGKTFYHLGVGVVIPLDREGREKGERFTMDLQIIATHYKWMPKRATDKLLSIDEREVMVRAQ